jgi:hypothetical protein
MYSLSRAVKYITVITFSSLDDAYAIAVTTTMYLIYTCIHALSRAFSGPYEGRGPNGRLADVLFVAFLASGYWAADLGTFDQVANGALVSTI